MHNHGYRDRVGMLAGMQEANTAREPTPDEVKEKERQQREFLLREKAINVFDTVLKYGSIEDVIDLTRAIRPYAVRAIERD